MIHHLLAIINLKKFFQLFDKHNINLCVGVIPFYENKGVVTPLDENNSFHLLEAQQKGFTDYAIITDLFPSGLKTKNKKYAILLER